MMTPIANILSRLESVKQTKSDRWTAICPGHDDRNPSLSIGLGDDERVLLHCWAGCGAGDVVEAVGLELKDLFEQPIKCHKPGRQRIYPNYQKILQMLRHEISVVLILTLDVDSGKQLTNQDMDTFLRAYSNIEKVMVASNV